MRNVVFKFKHNDCFGCDSTSCFPNIKLVVGNTFGAGEITHLEWTVIGDSSKSIEKFIKKLETYPAVLKVLVSNKSEKIYKITTITQTTDLIVDSIRDYHTKYYELEPMSVENGWEKWNIVIDEKIVNKFLEAVKKEGELKIIKIKDFKPEDISSPYGLTDKQSEILKFAYENDYYLWPRKISLEELAKKFKLTKRGFYESLKVGETKILGKIVGEL